MAPSKTRSSKKSAPKSAGLSAAAKQAVAARKKLRGSSKKASPRGPVAPDKTTRTHPDARQSVLRRAGLSERSELTAEQCKRADSAPASLNGSALAKRIMNGDAGKSKSTSTAAGSGERGPKSTGIVAAIEKVLDGASPKEKKEGLDASTITERILKGGLAPDLKGKTPRNTVAARLSTGKQFKKVTRGHYKLAK